MLDIDTVRDQRYRTPVATGCSERTRADDHLVGFLERKMIESSQSLELPRSERRQQPVVGHVVEGRPTGSPDKRGVRHVVDPEHRMGEPPQARGEKNLTPNDLVRKWSEPAGDGLKRAKRAEPSVTSDPALMRKLRKAPRPNVEEHISRRLDEKDAERLVPAQELL